MDHYKTLGVSRDASKAEIQKAYRQLAMKYHPDRNPNDKEAAKKFKDLALAFEVLNDDQKRSEYDRYGDRGPGPNIHRGGFYNDPFSIFKEFFGDMHDRTRSHVPDDITTSVTITLEEAFKGCKKKISYSTLSECAECDGSGATEWQTCSVCGGSGRLQARISGAINVAMHCSNCHGDGSVPLNTCLKCNGDGMTKDSPQTYDLDIPSGIFDNTRLVIKGKGNAYNGIYGNLVCVVSIKPHDVYERVNDDLFRVVPITFPQAVLGDTVDIVLLSSKRCELKIKKGIQSGDVLKMKNMGMPVFRRHGKHGDLFVRVEVQTPKNPNKEYLELIRKLRELEKSKK